MAKINANTIKEVRTASPDARFIMKVPGSSELVAFKAADYYTAIINAVSNSLTPSYEEVEISSAELLTLGTSPIELLPAPGAGTYLDVEKVILEFSFGGTNYSFPVDYLYVGSFNWQMISSGLITSGADAVATLTNLDLGSIDSGEGLTTVLNQTLNTALEIGTYNGGDPTLGNGTLLVKIWYTTRTAGSEL